jgi:transposase InsO family protein
VLLACSIDGGFSDFIEQDMRLPIEHAVTLLDRRTSDGLGEMALSRRLALNALEKGNVNRQPGPGFVHRSDQGVQCDCRDYSRMLRDHRMMSSMSRPENSHGNDSCKSFMKTLKREVIHANDHRDLKQLIESVEEFV